MSSGPSGSGGGLWACVAVATLTAFQFGYHSGVINQPRDAMTKCDHEESLASRTRDANCIPMDDWQWGTFVSIFLVGGVIGALPAGTLATTYGRRRLLLLINVPFLLAALLLALATTASQLYAARLIAGIAAGAGTVVLPLYLAEIAPVALRGSIGSLNQLMIVIGILVAQVVGLPLATREGWRTLMALAGLPAAVQVVLLFGCVETPSWLASHGLLHDARKSLAFLRGGDRGNLASDGQGDEGTSSNPIDRELDDIFSAAGVSSTSTTTDGATSSTSLLLPAASPQPKVTVANLFSVRALRRPLLAAFGLQVAQQFSGINAAIYYSTTIFQQSYDPTTAIRLTLLVSVTNLLTTLLSSSLIERAGRRTLLLTATLGMSLSAALVAGAVRAPSSPTEAVVVGLMAFVGFFGVGLGSIPWLILPELVPGYAVGPAASVCTSVNWSASFALAFVLPKAIGALGYDIFFVFSALLVGFALFTYRYVPETKGLTPEEVAVRNGFV